MKLFLVWIKCTHVLSPLFMCQFVVQTERVVFVKSPNSLVGFYLLCCRNRLFVGRWQPLLPFSPLKLLLAQLPREEPVAEWKCVPFPPAPVSMPPLESSMPPLPILSQRLRRAHKFTGGFLHTCHLGMQTKLWPLANHLHFPTSLRNSLLLHK